MTLVVSVALLFPGTGSVVVLVTVTVLLRTVPSAVVASTFTMSVNVTDIPAGSVAMLQLTVPVPPTAGVLQVKAGPPFWASETKVVFAGIGSLTETLWAALGPALAMVRV